MITNYWRNKIQDYLFTGVSFTPPVTYYIALSKTEPQVDGTGITEPVGGGYSRIAITRNTSSFTSSVAGVVKNKITLLSPESTDAWGVLPYYAVFDSSSGGNPLWGGALANSRNIDVEMQLLIDPNGISFTLS